MLNIDVSAATAEIMRIRKERLESGLYFMVNDKNLPSGQSYLEYRDRIVLVEISENGREFIPIKTLTPEECTELRCKFKLV